MAYVFAGLIGLVALIGALRQATRRLKTAEAGLEKAAQRRVAQVERIRRAARTTLKLSRELAELRRRKAAAEAACDDLENHLNAARSYDRRLYVLDDRRTRADVAWVLTVVNLDYLGRVNPKAGKAIATSWRGGRRIMVWALDEAKAREKLSGRYSEHRGFEVRGIERT